ncbi:MAG: DMT family transporter [Planctomycetaceae bacterium]|nr:DMT family transporter [Planctomycetaceae bacterium]
MIHERPTDFGRAMAALITVQILFGLHYPAAREIVTAIHPQAWTGLRVAGAALVVLPLFVILRAPWPKGGREWGSLLALSVFGVFINQWAFAEGIARSTSTHGVIIMALIPLISLLLAVSAKQERFTFHKAVSVLIGLTGMMVLLHADEILLGNTSAFMKTRDGETAKRFLDTVLAGDLMMVANATSYSVFLVLSKHLTKTMSPLTMTMGLYVWGALLVVPIVAMPTLADVNITGLSLTHTLIAIFIILGPTFATYFLNIFCLKRLPTSLVSIFIYLQVLVAASFGILFQGDVVDWRVGVAALLVLGGLSLRIVRSRDPVPAHGGMVAAGERAG